MSVGWAILALVAFWCFGGVALRVVGLVLLVGVSLTAGDPGFWKTVEVALVVLPAALAMWLGGHFHFAVRHGFFMSLIAARMLSRLPDRLDPTGGWEVMRR